MSANHIKVQCIYCELTTNQTNINKHQNNCYLNPVNLKECPICSNPVKNYKTSITCSYSCSNKLFRTGPNNGSWKEDSYRSTCFHHHIKKCVICGESNIVAVHHLDEDHSNNDPANLIPICPTHHSYMHSSYKHMIEKQVIDYITNWSLVKVVL